MRERGHPSNGPKPPPNATAPPNTGPVHRQGGRKPASHTATPPPPSRTPPRGDIYACGGMASPDSRGVRYSSVTAVTPPGAGDGLPGPGPERMTMMMTMMTAAWRVGDSPPAPPPPPQSGAVSRYNRYKLGAGMSSPALRMTLPSRAYTGTPGGAPMNCRCGCRMSGAQKRQST
jgi:hypothetical protein